jgi:heme a synthase
MTPSSGVTLLFLGAFAALIPLLWVAYRQRNTDAQSRYCALVTITLFLTFDLVVFGAFTRLTDSGLGCPDWPGCYGSSTPLGAHTSIDAAQVAMPTGPVTWSKAWIEMIHRYLAMGVGALVLVMLTTAAIAAWRKRAWATPGWAFLTLLWVLMQGLFGMLTVTLKLYPAIVTAHLLGGLGLLILLALQTQTYNGQCQPLPKTLRWAAAAMGLLTLLQITLGGWVSTNYAVLACSDFPTCQGQWWPPTDFPQGFALLRPLGLAHDGSTLSFSALTAIHMAHRLGAAVLLLAMAAFIWHLTRSPVPGAKRWAMWLSTALVWQLLSGLGNVILGWPLWAALAHTSGAAVLITLLAIMAGPIPNQDPAQDHTK